MLESSQYQNQTIAPIAPHANVSRTNSWSIPTPPPPHTRTAILSEYC
jgi:hypothetical protein